MSDSRFTTDVAMAISASTDTDDVCRLTACIDRINGNSSDGNSAQVQVVLDNLPAKHWCQPHQFRHVAYYVLDQNVSLIADIEPTKLWHKSTTQPTDIRPINLHTVLCNLMSRDGGSELSLVLIWWSVAAIKTYSCTASMLALQCS